MTEPRNCPFCGASGDELAVLRFQWGLYRVWCSNCGCNGPAYDWKQNPPDPDSEKGRAIAAWNSRVPPA